MGAVSPIRSLLVANRGEIALRILRTTRRLGLRGIAVFSDADEASLAVAAADEAVRIGPASASASYLDIGAIIAAARASGADAVHPAYGFLAENADFAEACASAGLTFVGPSPAAIRAMGDKGRARQMMAAAGLPVVPGYDGADQGLPAFEAAAAAIGFPVLAKAAAGGGGKGMRVVERSEDLPAALQSARREALSAFGDERMILERYVQNPRHVEVQVFGDSFGEVVHLFERDCSLQRRHQKVVEEAPAPFLSEGLRQSLRQGAITVARQVGYVGAGTVEFLVAGEQFFFMEMNTRLQVEHPVTEAITGLDLVEWQIRVAGGERLPLAQSEITMAGHAVEVRLCAEDPAQDFLPQTGRINHWRLPVGREGIRVDSGFARGDIVSIHYDSLLAKIVAAGRDRAEALAQLRTALREVEVAGLPTNREFLAAIAGHPGFAAGELDTGFIARHLDELIRLQEPDATATALAAFAALRFAERDAARVPDPADAFSPWSMTTGWRLGGRAARQLNLVHVGQTLSFAAQTIEAGYVLRQGEEAWRVEGELGPDGRLAARVGDRRLEAQVVREGHALTLFLAGQAHHYTFVDPTHPPGKQDAHAGALTSPMPGVVIAVAASPGAAVTKGMPLVVIEAMKMEHALKAPRDGRVAAVHVTVGDQVLAGAELVVLEEAP